MIVAIIQARMGSTRLPGKTLAQVCGKPLLEHLIERIKMSQYVEDVIIATTTHERDDVLVQFAQELGVKHYRGSESDVLDRVYQAAKLYAVKTIVRVTPDCPLLDPKVMDKVIEVCLSGSYDYVSNTLLYTWPDGLDVEAFSIEALERAWREAQLPSEREHVTSYFRSSGHFRLQNVDCPIGNLSHLRWSIDFEQDLQLVQTVYERLYQNGRVFFMEDILKLLQQEPSLPALNRGVVNEGYYLTLAKDPPLKPRPRSLAISYALKERASRLIPSQTQTFSKGPSQFVQGPSPVFLQKGEGCHVWDVDGNEYIDHTMALGPIILGYNNPAVTQAVLKQVREGTIFTLPHPLEVEVADLLCEIIPCAEMVRFGTNGSDATSGAVRLARAYTGRDLIACCGYHGWQDWYIGTTTRNKGVPQAVRELTMPFEYNGIETLEKIFDEHPGQVAAVIMEPVGVEPPKPEFLEAVKALAHRESALLIFDEVVTGFRVALGGAQEYFKVIPDLACFGKAMGNGYPVAAVVGRREVMEVFDEVFFSFTFGGEAVSLAAALATIQEIREKKVIPYLWHHGQRLKDGYNVLARAFGIDAVTECLGFPPRTTIGFKGRDETESLLMKSLFQQECIKRGILFTGAHNLCFNHTDTEIEYTLRVYRTAMEILAEAIRKGNVAERLEGEPVQPVFRRP